MRRFFADVNKLGKELAHARALEHTTDIQTTHREKTPSFLRLLPVGFTEKRTDRVEIGHKQTVGQLKTTPPSLGAATKTSQKIKKRWTEMREEKDTDIRSSDSAAQKNGSVGKRVSREPWLFNGAQPNDVQHFLDRLERLWQKDVG